MPFSSWKTSQVNFIAVRGSNHLLIPVTYLVPLPTPVAQLFALVPSHRGQRTSLHLTSRRRWSAPGQTGRPWNFACRIFPSHNPALHKTYICRSAAIYPRGISLSHIEVVHIFRCISGPIGHSTVSSYISVGQPLTTTYRAMMHCYLLYKLAIPSKQGPLTCQHTISPFYIFHIWFAHF